ncbi:MAG: hypothetical protein WDW36_005018 [Sanguina aurantia]
MRSTVPSLAHPQRQVHHTGAPTTSGKPLPSSVLCRVSSAISISFPINYDSPKPSKTNKGGSMSSVSSMDSYGGTVVRKLILLRHADSETSSNGTTGAAVKDHDRPISRVGKREAASVALKLRNLGWVPDLVIGSNSLRTKQTLEELYQVIPEMRNVDGHFYGSLYTVGALDGQTKSHLLECLSEVVEDSKNSCVLLCGHNRGWEEAASAFAGQAIKLRTASAALLQCVSTSWGDVLTEENRWQLVAVVEPGL